jgi:hypothetical protein
MFYADDVNFLLGITAVLVSVETTSGTLPAGEKSLTYGY